MRLAQTEANTVLPAHKARVAPYLPKAAYWFLLASPPVLALVFDPSMRGKSGWNAVGSLGAVWFFVGVSGLMVHLAANYFGRRWFAPKDLRATSSWVSRAFAYLAFTALTVAIMGMMTLITFPVLEYLCVAASGEEWAVFIRGVIIAFVYVAMARVAQKTVVAKGDARDAIKERDVAKAEQARIEAEGARLTAEAQWKALESRLAPHFLFNSLNTLIALIREQPKAAENLAYDLSDLLRDALTSSSQAGRSLADELTFVERYLAIEKARFGERLHWTAHLENMSDVLVPTMLLQPLVENAVKHGVAPRMSGAEILIRASEAQGLLILQVETRWRGETDGMPQQGTGHGLVMTRSRVERFGTSTTHSTPPNGPVGALRVQVEEDRHVVVITLPIIRARVREGITAA